MDKPGTIERVARLTPLAIAVALADLLGVATFALSKTLQDWVSQHPLTTIAIMATLFLGLVVITNILARNLVSVRGERDSAMRQLASLKAVAQATGRDTRNFAKVLESLPWTESTMSYLELSFQAKKWSDQSVEAIHRFAHEWRHEFFDEAEVQSAFGELRAAFESLSDWLGGEGFPSRDNPKINVIREPHELQGGDEQYRRIRSEGMQLARDVIAARKRFEAVGRARGL